MKKAIILVGCSLAFFLFAQSLHAQKGDSLSHRMINKTIMSDFEPNFVLQPSERDSIQQKMLGYQKKIKRMIDTLDLSDGKRNKWLQELDQNPYSLKITAFMAKQLEKDANKKKASDKKKATTKKKETKEKS